MKAWYSIVPSILCSWKEVYLDTLLRGFEKSIEMQHKQIYYQYKKQPTIIYIQLIFLFNLNQRILSNSSCIMIEIGVYFHLFVYNFKK